MVVTLAQLTLPALGLYTALFGVLARGEAVGSAVLFWRVGLAGLALGVALLAARAKVPLFADSGAWLANATIGICAAGLLVLGFAAFGSALKRRAA